MNLMKKRNTILAYRRKDGVVDRLSVTDLFGEARERRDRMTAGSNFTILLYKTLWDKSTLLS